MSINTAVTPSSSRRRPRRGSRRPASVLFHTEAIVAIHSSSTTATDHTRNGEPIQVSFCFKRPPQPSTLFVHSSDLNHNVHPDIICSVDDLLLLRVNMGHDAYDIYPKDYDYFVYRADPTRPSLELLRHPHLSFDAHDVGILPRSDGQYTVAVLIATRTLHEYKLHLLHSRTSSWSSCMLTLPAPRNDFPVKICRNYGPLIHKHTSTVITIGGEGGTMGWVDLWHGIVLCDVLDPKPSLRGIPLPLLSVKIGDNNVHGIGNPAQRRGIAFIRSTGCLKFVHLEITDIRLPDLDDETGAPCFRVDGWSLTTWSYNVMSNSPEDWHNDHVVQASNIRIDDLAISGFLEHSGLLHKPKSNEATAEQRDLPNLSMYQPSPCLSGEDVVYLVARVKNRHPKAWILAVDMKNGGRLQAAAYFGIPVQYSGHSLIYCLSKISKYMNRTKYINPAAAPVSSASIADDYTALASFPRTAYICDLGKDAGKGAEESHEAVVV